MWGDHSLVWSSLPGGSFLPTSTNLASFHIHFSCNRSHQRGDRPSPRCNLRCNLTELWCLKWTSRLSYITLTRISVFIFDLTYSYNIGNVKTMSNKGKHWLENEKYLRKLFKSKIHVHAGSTIPIPNSHIRWTNPSVSPQPFMDAFNC